MNDIEATLIEQPELVCLPRMIDPPAGSKPRHPVGVRVRSVTRPRQAGRVRAALYTENNRWEYIVAWDLSCPDWFHLRMIGWTDERLTLDVRRAAISQHVCAPTYERFHEVLRAEGGNLSRAAKALGVPLTTALRWKATLRSSLPGRPRQS